MFHRLPYLYLLFTEFRKNRSQMVKDIEELVFKNILHLVLHWDCSSLPKIATGNVKTPEDQFPAVTAKDFEVLIEEPVAQKGTGEKMAQVVFQELCQLCLYDNIIGLLFDNTVSFTRKL